MANAQPTKSIKDDGKRLRLLDKGIRGEGAASIFTRAPLINEHFIENFLVGTKFSGAAGIIGAGSLFTSTQTGTGTATNVVTAGALGGVAKMSTPAFAVESLEFAGTNVCWEPDALGTGQKLVFEARVRITPTAQQSFWGFGNAATAAIVAGNSVAISAASVLTAGMNDMGGFCYSSVPTSGALDQAGTTTNYFGVASATNAAATNLVASTGVGGDALFHVYRIEVEASGNADYFIDDRFVNHQQYVAATSGFKPTIKFTPYFNIITTTTTVAALEIDYVVVSSTMQLGV